MPTSWVQNMSYTDSMDIFFDHVSQDKIMERNEIWIGVVFCTNEQ